MGFAKRTILGGAVWVAAFAFLMASAQAQVELWEGDETYGEVGANLQLMTAYVDMRDLETFALLADIPREAGLGGAVGRLEWSFDLGSRVDVDVHNRLFWQTSTLPEDLLFQGLGVSAGEDRRLSTELELIDGETTQLTHDIDRLVVALYFGLVDFYVGRQAIRWGVSDMFTVADRFAPLSPFELDTLQRRGIDAARAVTHLSPSVELDLVVADRGQGEPLSMGARAEYFGSRIDAYGGVGRFWQRLSTMSGLSVLVDHYKFFGEAELLWNLDEDQLDRPRATLGAQRVSMDWQIGAEYHYNGFGVARDGEYVDALAQPELARGETYFLGRHYAGINGFYFTDGGWALGGGTIANIIDPSVIVFPAIEYEVEAQFSVRAGAYVGFGEGAQLDFGEDMEEPVAPQDAVSLGSEFGAVSDLYFLQMTAFF